ncbi:MAG: hypothetical protein CMI75_07325 [Candidatus Pelagibacter sp.]|nr:hypothetical protein [Candidatus Pelagibacter sp.]|tara:strand:+ start:673 stop:3159 length:2487 start_codon:yes stop_codon:yes gene_type:complete
MAIDKLGTNEDPDIKVQGSSVEIVPDTTRDEQIAAAAQILVDDEEILLDQEIQQELAPQMSFDANLVDFIDEITLEKISSDLLSSIRSDKQSRSEWEKTYTDGLKYLGMKFDETRSQPFEGSSGVVHPILAEAVTQFQAQAYKEMLPAKGPVKTEIVGARTIETENQAERVQEFMNYYIMNKMDEYDPELDQMLFYLPLAGSCFKKVYFDFVLNRAVSKFIAPEDLIVPYEAADMSSAERITHSITMSANEIKKQQVSGFYANVDIGSGGISEDMNDIDEAIDEIQGISPSYKENRNRTVYEVHTVLDIEGFEDMDQGGEPTGLKLPYIVTIEEDSEQVLSIRRNYVETDPYKNKINYFVQYKFLPGLGFYGLGLSHMIGGLSKASTSILRQLIDAGTLANLPAGFKARGMRIRDEDDPLQPGEFRDIDTTGGSLRENLIPLPIKEPSSVLMQLLGILVDSGKRFAAIADMNVGDMNQAMPVGTTVALLERGTKVMSAIHKRLHYAQRIEFGLLAKVFSEYLPPVYTYQVGSGPGEVKQQDFDDRVDIVPISDPNIFSQSQRVTLAQELLQMVQSNPEIHGPLGIYEAYRRMYAALGVDNVDALLQPPPDNTPKPMDAGLENAGLLMGQPAQAFPEQNHQAHLDAHKSLFLTDIVKQSPQVQALIISHCMQHLQFMAMQMAQEQMPPEVQQKMQEIQSQIQQVSPQEAMQIQQQMQMVTEQYSSTIMAQLANEFLQSIGMGSSEDPLVDIRNRELDLKDKELNMESEQFVAKQDQRQQEKMMDGQLQQERINVQKEIADDKLGVALDRLKQNADLKLFELENKIRGIL